MKTELFEEDQHDSHENISFNVEPEIKTEPDEQNFKKSQTNSKTEEDESRNWNFDEKLDKENYENCKKCDKLSKGESTEKLRHSRNCNELAGYFILSDLRYYRVFHGKVNKVMRCPVKRRLPNILHHNLIFLTC